MTTVRRQHELRRSGPHRPFVSESQQDDRQGSVLLFALIVLASVIISSVGLGSLIINSLQQTKTLDSAAVAFYAAESAVEQAIWQVRRSEEIDAPLPPPVPDPSKPLDRPVEQDNGAVWQRLVSDEEKEIKLAIPKDNFVELHLFEPTANLGGLSNWAGGIKSIRFLELSWESPHADCLNPSAPPCPVLFAEWVRWNPDSLDHDPFSPDNPGIQVFSFRYPTVEGQSVTIPPSPAMVPPDQEFPERLRVPDYAYRIRLRAEHAPMRDVTVRGYDDSYDPVNIPGRVTVEAIGEYAGVQQKLTVRIPRKSPLSSLFDFAIFSECSLVKGYPISCP